MSVERALCLGIVHVPKSGGTAVANVLRAIPDVYGGPLYFDRAHFGSDRLVEGVPSPNADTIASEAELAAVVKTHRAVIGHYSAPTLLAAGCTALAVQVREPRSRILSLYRFWQGQPIDERSSWGLWGSELVASAERPLAAFLRASVAWPATDNAMRRQIFGGQVDRPSRRSLFPMRRPTPDDQSATVRAAIEIADWADRSEAFVTKVCSLVGVAEIPTLSRDNVTEVRDGPQEIDRITLELLSRLTERDSALLTGLMRDGVLERRSAAELDDEFRETAGRLSFRLTG